MFCTDGKAVDFVNSCRMRHSDFEVVKVIGRGAFGEVQLVSGLCIDCVWYRQIMIVKVGYYDVLINKVLSVLEVDAMHCLSLHTRE